MPTNYNIIYLSYYPWSNQGSRYINLAQALSVHPKVKSLHFLNPMGSIGNIKQFIKDPRMFSNFGFYHKILNVPFPVYDCVAPIPFKGSFKFAKNIHNRWNRWVAKKMISTNSEFKGLLIVQTPSEDSLATILLAKKNGYLTIFDWADLFEQFAGSDSMREAVASLCRDIASAVDIVCCVSPYLRNIALPYNKRTYLSPNAVPGNFIAAEYKSIRDKQIRLKSPRICYYGLINSIKLDFSLIDEIAALRPDWHFEFIGPQMDIMQTNEKISAKNIHFIPPMVQLKLHGYLRENIDICFNPYRTEDEPNKACSPMKLYETLGNGLPFVSTDVFDPLDSNSLISIGGNAKDIILKMEYELENDSIERRNLRIAYAKKNTWDIRADEMIASIDSFEYFLVKDI